MPKNIPVVMSSLELSVIAHTIVWLFVKRRRKLDYRTLHHITESGVMPSADGKLSSLYPHTEARLRACPTMETYNLHGSLQTFVLYGRRILCPVLL